MNDQVQMIQDLAETLTDRVTKVTANVAQLLDTPEEKLAVLLVALVAMFEATTGIAAEVAPTFRKLDHVLRTVALNTVIAQALLEAEELRRPLTDPRLHGALAELSLALKRSVRP